MHEESNVSSLCDDESNGPNTTKENQSSASAPPARRHGVSRSPGVIVDAGSGRNGKLMRRTSNIARLAAMNRESLFTMDDVNKIFDKEATGLFGVNGSRVDGSGPVDGKVRING
jgi:hypothetical protein